MLFNKFKKDVEDDCTEVYQSITYTILNEFMSEQRNITVKDYIENNIDHLYNVYITGNNNYKYSHVIYDYVFNSGVVFCWQNHYVEFSTYMGYGISLRYYDYDSFERKIQYITVALFIDVIILDNEKSLNTLNDLNYQKIENLLFNNFVNVFNGYKNVNIMKQVLNNITSKSNYVFNHNYFKDFIFFNIDNISDNTLNEIVEKYMSASNHEIIDLTIHFSIINTICYLYSTIFNVKTVEELKKIEEYKSTTNIMMKNYKNYDYHIDLDEEEDNHDPRPLLIDVLNSYQENKDVIPIEHIANIDGRLLV